MRCYRCSFDNSAYAKRCQNCRANISTVNTPLSSNKRAFLILLISTPILLLSAISLFSAPFISIFVLMILIPLLFFTLQYYKMKIHNDFLPLNISKLYIFAYYFSVSMLFIQNTRLSMTLLILGYISIHLLAYFIFISIISRHQEWVMSYGIFEKSTRVDRDKKLKSVYSSESLKATIAMLTKIAKCDGAVSIDEAQFIKKVIDNAISIARRDGVDDREAKRLRGELVDTYKSVKNNDKSIDYYAHHFTKYSYFQRVSILQELISMAKIEYLSSSKIEMLYSVGEVFGFEYSKIESYIGVEEESYTEDIDRAYSILNSKEGDDRAVIKKRYRRLVKEYHPDTIYSKSTDESFELLAKEKMQELNDAYELIKSKNEW